MATNVGAVEMSVDADGSDFERQLRAIGQRAGAQAGRQLGTSLRQQFKRETMRMNSDGSMEVMTESFSNAFKEIDKGLKKNSAAFGRHGRLIRSHVGRTIAAWSILIAVIGQATGALGAGLGAILSAVISSLGVGLVGALALAGTALVGFIGLVGLAANSMRFLKDEAPEVGVALGKLSDAAESSGRRFADAWGPSLAGFLTRLSDVLGDTAMVDAFAASLSRITDAFTAVMDSPGFTMFMEQMRTGIPNALGGIGSGFASLLGGLLAVFAGATPALERFAGLFATWAANWQTTMEQMAADGRLQKFFDLALDSLIAVFDVLGSLGGALVTFFTAGAPYGNAMLEQIAGLLDTFNTWMQSVEGQTALETFFTNGQRIFDALLELLGAVGTALGELVTPESIDSLITFLEALGEALPVLTDILGLFGDLQILTLFSEMLTTIGELLAPLMPVLTQFAETLGVMLVEAMIELGPKFAELGAALVPLLIIIAELAVAILPSLIDIILIVVDSVTAFMDTMFSATGSSEEFATGVETMGTIVSTIFETIANIIEASMIATQGILKATGQLLTGDFSGAFETMGNIAKGVFEAFGIDFDGMITDLGQGIANGLAGLENWGDDVGGVMGDVIKAIKEAISWFLSLFGTANNIGTIKGKVGGGGGGGTGARFMASGGTLWGPTKVIAGEAGPEAIVPLRRNLNQVHPSVRWLSAIAQGKYPAMGSGGTFGAGGGRSVLVEAGAIVVQGTTNPDAVAVGVMNRMAERLA